MTHPHPCYRHAITHPMGQLPEIRESGQGVLIGDEVAHVENPNDTIGIITAIYAESAEAGNQLWLVEQLVLLKRAEP